MLRNKRKKESIKTDKHPGLTSRLPEEIFQIFRILRLGKNQGTLVEMANSDTSSCERGA